MPSPLFLLLDFLATSFLCTLAFITGAILAKGKIVYWRNAYQDSCDDAEYWQSAYQEMLDTYTDPVSKESADHV